MKTLNEFLLVISPSQTIMDYVSYLKQELKRILGHDYPSIFSIAHITLFPYEEYHAESFLYQMENEVSKQTPFYVHVRDFHFFKHGSNRTIHLNIERKSPISDLAKPWTRRVITPHITIARNLEFNDFLKVWPILKDISYSNYFICDRVTVLKRRQGYWDSHLELPFAQRKDRNFYGSDRPNKAIL